jgi:hypothetical protein
MESLIKAYFSSTPIVLVLSLHALACRSEKPEGVKQEKYGTFSFEHQLTLPGVPERIYDAISGDISGWWDHSFSGSPAKLYIEPRPGGGFYEIFDDSSNGVLHATVIYADRGKLLRFDGPLGLSGRALQLVCTYEFEAAGQDSTLLKLSVHGSGEIEESMPGVIRQVWHHFLFERFKPYVESEEDTKKSE